MRTYTVVLDVEVMVKIDGSKTVLPTVTEIVPRLDLTQKCLHLVGGAYWLVMLL